jgi:DNA recombination protein RmuC
VSAALWLLAGLAAGATISGLAVRARLRLRLVRLEAELDRGRSSAGVAELLAPIRDSLSRVDGQLAHIEAERLREHGSLHAQLRTLADNSERLRTETGALVAALRRPQTRGRWGEMQLRRVVEMAGMLAHCDFHEQLTVHSPDGAVRPDLVINMPGGRHVVVDAKAPLAAFLDAYEARDEAERRAHLDAHARHLREHIRRLSAKSYWVQFPSAPDFVFLFLPGEHFYNAALEADPTLLEEGVNQSVLVATPTTLIALLRAVAYGWRQEGLAQGAREVADLGRELHARLAVLAEHVQTLGRRLNGAVGAYNDAVGSLEARVLPSARRLAERGGEQGREPSAAEPIDLNARPVRAPELRAGV